MIVDSSVWVDFLSRRPGVAARALRSFLSNGGPVFLTPVIVQEVVQGARDVAHLASLNRALAVFPLCQPGDVRASAREAGALYARCRWQGVTIRSPNDCLIAVTAIEHRQPVMTLDRDFLLLRSIDARLQLIDAHAEN